MKRLELEREITINKPVEEVFAYINDPKKIKEWRIGLVKIKPITEPPNKKGSKTAEIVNIMGKNFKTIQEITGFEQNKKRELKVKLGPITLNMFESYQEKDGNTLFKVKGIAELKGIQKFFGTAILKKVGKQLVEELANIKSKLEA